MLLFEVSKELLLSNFYSTIHKCHQILRKIEKHTSEGDLVSAKVWFDNLQIGMKELENGLKYQPEPEHIGEMVLLSEFNAWVQSSEDYPELACKKVLECGGKCVRTSSHRGDCFCGGSEKVTTTAHGKTNTYVIANTCPA